MYNEKIIINIILSKTYDTKKKMKITFILEKSNFFFNNSFCGNFFNKFDINKNETYFLTKFIFITLNQDRNILHYS